MFEGGFYGPPDPIKDMMRPDYQEPESPPNLLVLSKLGKLKGSFADNLRSIDCYMGICDGYSYRSYDRLSRQRTKFLWKPVGPTEMYKYPGCKSMDVGWFLDDPVLKTEEGGSWCKNRRTYGIPTSPDTKFVESCLKVDKYFKL